MKREFGSKLIEEFFPRVDLTHVIDTSGAYIPGHGTPTVILFGRHRRARSTTVRTVMGIKGEPSQPAEPACGLVWTAICRQTDRPGTTGDFVSVADTPRAALMKHPWSLGGGGASDLRNEIERGRPRLSQYAGQVGITAVNGQDEIFLLADQSHVRRLALERVKPMVTGDLVRDWCAEAVPAVWPYDGGFNLIPVETLPRVHAHLWTARAVISRRKRFGTPMLERGLTWYEFQELYVEKLKSPLTITLSEVATHNHFALDRGGRVFKQTAPVIKLPENTSEADHLGLLGLLNSSVSCFWLKQVCHNKGEGGGTRVEAGNSALGDEAWKSHFAFNSTKVGDFPLTEVQPTALALSLNAEAQALGRSQPASVASGCIPTRETLSKAKSCADEIRAKMVSIQEELDWQCYRLYGFSAADVTLEHPSPPPISLGQRAFEIVLARRLAAGTEETTWFTRHGSTPITEIPSHWPADYRAVVERRIAKIESDRQIALIERPEYKRRWNSEPWEVAEQRALRDWLLDRLETDRYWAPRASADRTPQLLSVAQLADRVRDDADFMQVAALYAGDDAFDVTRLLGELVAAESVPYLPALRYTEEGLRKRAAWEQTWALQREEDARGVSLDIPVPPKYTKADFQGGDAWRLRGALDVPKERFVSYPGATPDGDGTLLIGWAGWTHLQQATALATQYLALKEQEAWAPERLVPVLAGLAELVPWLKQWHNELDAVHGARMGDYFAGFVQDEARALGVSEEALAGWRPSPTGRGRARGRRPRTAAAAESSEG